MRLSARSGATAPLITETDFVAAGSSANGSSRLADQEKGERKTSPACLEEGPAFSAKTNGNAPRRWSRPCFGLGRPTTTPRDRKELLRALIEEVIVSVDRNEPAAHLTVRWKGGAITDVDVPLPRSRPAPSKPMRRQSTSSALGLALSDTVIAGILNRQGRKRARGLGSKPTGSPVSDPLAYPLL